MARASAGSITSASGPHASACRTSPRRFRTSSRATRAPVSSVVTCAAGEELLRDARERAAEAHGRGRGRVDVVVPDLLARPAPDVERVRDVVVALLPALRARVRLVLRQPDLPQRAHARQVEDPDALPQMIVADEDPLAAPARPAVDVDVALDHLAARRRASRRCGRASAAPTRRRASGGACSPPRRALRSRAPPSRPRAAGAPCVPTTSLRSALSSSSRSGWCGEPERPDRRRSRPRRPRPRRARSGGSERRARVDGVADLLLAAAELLGLEVEPEPPQRVLVAA